MMWNSVSSLNAIAFWGLWIGAVAGGIAVVAALAGGLAASRVSEITNRAASIEISNANTRAEEAKAAAAKANAQAADAKAEAAKANERLRKSQEARGLTTSQTEELSRLFRSDVFQKPAARKLRVSSVEDAEARMFAMQFQNLLHSCGVDIFPTDGGFPATCVQLTPDASPLTLTVRSSDISPEMQHLAHFERTMLALGFDMKIEYDPKLKPNEGVLHVLRKACV
jgi:hypothetical protein